MNSSNIEIKTAQRQAFMEVFELVSTNKRINRDALKRLFEIINYRITYEQFNEIATRAFSVKQWITYEQFMQLFIIKTNDFSIVDIKNALKLLAGDDDMYISVEKLKKMLQTEGQSEQRIRDTIKLLGAFIDNSQRFNYKEFLKSLN